jgi:membrane-associated phospholipid phosphatase
MLHVGWQVRVPDTRTVSFPVPEVEQAEKPAGLMTGLALVSLVVAMLSLLLFSWIANEVREGETARFDLAVRSWIHRFFTPGLTRVMVVASELGASVLIGLFVASLAIFIVLRWRRAALWLLVTMAGALLLDVSLKSGFHRARPTPFYGPLPHTYSFPSGHALFSFCFYGVVAGLINDRIKSPWLRILVCVAAILLISVIGLSRIYLGVHYPSDVIAGYLAAAVWVAAMIFLDRLRIHRRQNRTRTS